MQGLTPDSVVIHVWSVYTAVVWVLSEALFVIVSNVSTCDGVCLNLFLYVLLLEFLFSCGWIDNSGVGRGREVRRQLYVGLYCGCGQFCIPLCVCACTLKKCIAYLDVCVCVYVCVCVCVCVRAPLL